MGCHCWIYKKVSALSKEEQIKLLDKTFKNLYDRTKNPREDFIKETVEKYKEDLEYWQGLVDNGEIKPGNYDYDCQYEIAKSFSDPVYLGELWDKDNERNKLKKELREKFDIDPTPELFLELYKLGHEEVRYHKGEPYVQVIFDTYFRCFKFGDGPIDNYSDMIKYLSPLHPNMIYQFGSFDKDGKFNYFNPKTYEPKKGLTDELKELLKFLYRENNIFIEFG